MVSVAILVAHFITLLLAGCSAKVDLPAGDPQHADVVLVSIDTLRADHLSSYGYERPTSPFIDGLAARGTRFSHTRSPSPWTLPAHVSLLAGQLPETHHVIEDTLALDPTTPVLPEVMGAAGYATGGFVGTMYVSRLFGFDRGFDRFEDFDIHSEKKNLGGSVDADDVVDEALDWWKRQAPGKPVFLFVHVYDVHYNYDPPRPYATLFDRATTGDDIRYKNYKHFKSHPVEAAELAHQVAQYDEAIRYVDGQIGRIGEAAIRAGRRVRWVVTADHGEEFGERGSWGHAHTLYSEQLRVPLVIAGDGLPEGRVVEGAVGLHDIAPTVAAWVGGSLRADGIDLGPVLAGSDPPGRPFPAETSRFDTNRVGLYEDALRLEWDLAADQAELFDDAADPAERVDLAAARPDDLARMKARLEEVWGAPWESLGGGIVKTTGALLFAGRHRSSAVEPGSRFQVVPADAELTLLRGGQALGPWQAVGGTRPVEGDPLVWRGTGGASGVTLDAKTREALEALGYVQGEE